MRTYSIIIFLCVCIMFCGCLDQESLSDDESFPQINTRYPITVFSVSDGDTIKAVIEDGRTITIRFLGIDTPELDEDRNYPFEYGNITNLSCLSEFAFYAKDEVLSLFKNDSGFIEFDDAAGMKDQYDRYLCYVYTDTMIDIQKELLELGYARVYDAEDFSKKQEYLTLQDYAMEHTLGLWSCE